MSRVVSSDCRTKTHFEATLEHYFLSIWERRGSVCESQGVSFKGPAKSAWLRHPAFSGQRFTSERQKKRSCVAQRVPCHREDCALGGSDWFQWFHRLLPFSKWFERIFPTLHFTSLPSWFVMLIWTLLACCIFKLRSNYIQYISIYYSRLLESFIILLVSRAWQDGNWRCDHCGALVVEWSEDPCGGFGSYRRWTMKSNPCWIVVAPASPNFNVAFGLRAWGRWTKKSNPNAEETI